MDDLAGAFALRALDPEERAWVELHSLDCPRCAELVARHRRVAAVIPFSLAEETPGPDVKASLFARIAQSERAAASATVATPSFSVTRRHAATRPPRERAPETPRPAPMRPAWRRLPAGIARGLFPDRRSLGWTALLAPIAAIPFLFALALGGWAMSLQGKIDDRTEELESLRSRLATMDGLLASDEGTVYELTAGPAAPSATGKIIADPARAEAIVMVWQLSDATLNTSYMVWVEEDGRMIHVGDLNVDAQGNGACQLRIDQPLSKYESVHITPVTYGVGGLASNVVSSVGSVGATGRTLSYDALSVQIDPAVGEPEDSTTSP